MSRLYIGTSGWSYPHWAKGVFYPSGLPQSRWLEYYAQIFTTVEANVTFYRPPREVMFQNWCKKTPHEFIFSIKLWRRISHDKRLNECEAELRDFLRPLALLGPKRGPVLVQCPPFLRADTGLFRSFLELISAQVLHEGYRFVVEFRNKDWLQPEVISLLDLYKVGLCLTDMPRCVVVHPNDVSWVYIRRHGPFGTYRGGYTPEQLQQDAEAISRWIQEGRDVYVYFNNDLEGHAVVNARQLQILLQPGNAGEF